MHTYCPKDTAVKRMQITSCKQTILRRIEVMWHVYNDFRWHFPHSMASCELNDLGFILASCPASDSPNGSWFPYFYKKKILSITKMLLKASHAFSTFLISEDPAGQMIWWISSESTQSCTAYIQCHSSLTSIKKNLLPNSPLNNQLESLMYL